MTDAPVIRVDRAGMIHELRELIDGLESGRIVTFHAELDITGIGTIKRKVVGPAHPTAPTFDTSDMTPTTLPGKGQK